MEVRMGEERGIGTAGGGRWTFEGVAYPTRSGMCLARRERYVALLGEGLNFTQAARMVGVSKRTGKVRRNGRAGRGGNRRWTDIVRPWTFPRTSARVICVRPSAS